MGAQAMLHRADPSTRPVADVQGSADPRDLPLQQVGIRGVRFPVAVHTRAGHPQHSVATLGMDIGLAGDRRGAHLSRFLEVAGTDPLAIQAGSLGRLLERMLVRLDAGSGRIDIAFPYFVCKNAPVSGSAGLIDYEVGVTVASNGHGAELSLRVAVPVTSLCPCSKAIADYGAHNQRSQVIVTLPTDGTLWIDDLIELVEAQASSELFALLKREDERLVTQRAYDNPKFVEDLVRDVAAQLERDPRVGAYRVSCENFESIHNHSAFALIERDGRPGLNGHG